MRLDSPATPRQRAAFAIGVSLLVAGLVIALAIDGARGTVIVGFVTTTAGLVLTIAGWWSHS